MREGPAAGGGARAGSTDAAEDARASWKHLQFVHQLMQEGPAVGGSAGAASPDATEEARANWEHLQFVHHFMQEGFALQAISPLRYVLVSALRAWRGICITSYFAVTGEADC